MVFIMNIVFRDIALLRCVGILLVVMAHATRSINSPNSHMFNPLITPGWEILIRNYIYTFHMPLFFFISGYLFRHKIFNYDASIKYQLINKFKRLIIPMYATSFLILLPTIVFFGKIDGSFFNQLKNFILTVNNDHLWFLRALFLIFLIFIPLFKCLNNDGILFYVCIFVIYCFIYNYNIYLYFLFIPVIKFMPFFLLGAIYYKFNNAIIKYHNFACTFILFVLHVFLFKNMSSSSFSLFTIIASFLGVLWIVSCCFMISQSVNNMNFWNFVIKINNYSFSIYLFHVSMVYLILYLFYLLNLNISFVRILLCFFLSLQFSIFLHNVFSKINILSFAFSIKKII